MKELGLTPAIETSGRLGAVHRAGALTFPKARSTESKYRSTPKRMKKMPKPVVPMPISATGKEVLVGWALGCGWGTGTFPHPHWTGAFWGWAGKIPFPARNLGLCSWGMMGQEGRMGTNLL